jgi:LDH2 family malate/lactate/ureidoglycolate dehydrogenase
MVCEGFVATEQPSNIGHFFLAFRPDLVMPVGEFRERMDHLIRELKETPPAPGRERVLVAGQPEDEATERHKIVGVPLDTKTVEGLRALSAELGVPFPA